LNLFLDLNYFSFSSPNVNAKPWADTCTLSDGFTHRPNRPWPRGPRFWGPSATLSYDD